MPRSAAVQILFPARPLSERRLLPIVFAALLLAVAAPVFIDDVPPLSDYINHLGRMHVIAAVGGDPVLARLYEIDWAIIPNLVMDLLVPPLGRMMDIYRAGQLFVVVTMLLLVTGPMAVHRALYGRLSLWPLVAFPFVYNGIMLFGFMNYLFGLGIALFGLAGWIAARERPAPARGALSALFVLACFFCHLFALGLYGVALLSFELWRLRANGRPAVRALTADLLAFGLPFLLVVPLMLASPTLGLSSQNVWESHGKLDGINLIVQTYWDGFDLAVAWLMGAAMVWAGRRRLLTLHPAGWMLLAVGTAVFLAMPRMLFGSWVADQRLPVALLFLTIGFARVELSDRGVRTAFLALLVGVTLARCLDVTVNWQALKRVNDEFHESAALMERGSSVLVAYADAPSGSQARIQALSHAPCIAMIDRDALVSTAFSVQGKQVLDIRPAYRDRVDAEDGDPPTISQLLATTDGPVPGQPHYWDGWPARYDYVYALYTDHGPNPDPDHLSPVYEGAGFQLYRVVRPAPGDDEPD